MLTTSIRFVAPLLGSDLVEGLIPGRPSSLRSWVYTTLASGNEALTWAKDTIRTLSLKETGGNIEAFIRHTDEHKRVPYQLPDGSLRYFSLYLIYDEDKHTNHGIFFHGAHAFLDAHPVIRVLRILFEHMSCPSSSKSASNLPWGEEGFYLPPGPVTATGGVKADWDPLGSDLLKNLGAAIMNPEV